MNPNVDLEKFAQKLARVGREAVKWEHRKLQWILEERAKQQEQASTEQSTAA